MNDEQSLSDYEFEAPSPPTLFDPWRPDRPILLSGPLERTAFRSPTFTFVMGILALGVSFILFQVLITPLVLLGQIAVSEGGMASLESFGDPGELLASYTRELILSNSVGQLLGLAVPALLLTRMHTSEVTSYLRLRRVDLRLVLLAVIGVVGLQPVVQWLAQVNKDLPLPEALRLMEQTQLELIRSVLESGLGLSFNLVMLAAIPGLCEELLFRGYIQRQFERATGATSGIFLSGILFGMYHLRPSQLLPLVVLGIYLAYLTWRTGSIWLAVLVHFLHNGIAVVAAWYARNHSTYDLEGLEQAPMPWYAVLGGFAIFASVLYVLDRLSLRIRDAAR